MDRRAAGSLAPGDMRRNPPPLMDPQAIRGLNFPFVHVPGDGTRAGHFAPRGTVPEFYANYTPQPPPPGCEEKAQHAPGPSVSYNIAQQQNVPSSNRMPTGMPTSGGSSISAAYSPSEHQLFPYQYLPPWLLPPDHKYPGDLLARPLTPSLGPPFLLQKQREWGIDFYIRIDHAGWYHTYPTVGGPFKGLHEVEFAINRYLEDLWDPKMSTMDNVSSVDIAVRNHLYRPDGTRRRRSGTEPVDEIRDGQRQLAHALVDKYNEDNNLLGDLAYELTKVECYQSFCEDDRRMWYNHINFTAKAKGAVCCEVFFAEVISIQGEELPVSCLCVIKSTDHGFCFSCANNGIHMRHPTSIRYAGGHVMRTFTPCNGPKMTTGYSDDDLKAEDARFRQSLEGCDWSRPPVLSPGSLAKLYTGPPVWDGGCWRMEEAA